MGQLLDLAIRLYRRNFLKFVGIIAIVQIPLGLLQLGASLLTFSGFSQFQEGQSSPDEIFTVAFFTGVIGSVIVALLSLVLIQVVATAAMTQAVTNSYLGQPVGIVDAYKAVGRSWVSLLGALFLAGLVSLVLILWTLVPCVGWLTGLGMLVFLGFVITPLLAPTIVLEKQKAWQSIRRAWDLARRRFWWVLGFVLILAIFAQIIITGPVLLLNMIFSFVFGNNPFAPSADQAMTQTIVQSLVSIAGSLIYLPLQLTAITLMYFDLRIRTEGFDLALLAESISTKQPDVAALTTQAPQPESGNPFSMTEMGYFALIELAALVLYFILVFILGAFFFVMLAASQASGF
jgi:hypothetical protein